MKNPRPDTVWLTAVGVTLRICTLSAASSVLAFPWWPLHRAARATEVADPDSAIHLDEFLVVGQIPRQRLASLWIYLHERTGRELFVDWTGTTHRLRPMRANPTAGRFLVCSIADAVHRLGLGAIQPGPLELSMPPRDPGTTAYVPDPRPFAHGTGIRSSPIARSPLSGRYPRSPLTDRPHPEATPGQVDDLGHCYDTGCDRCWVDGDPDLAPGLRDAIAPLYANLPPSPRRPDGQDLRPTRADYRLTPDLYVALPPWATPIPAVAPPPAPRARPQPAAPRPGPYRPWLRQVWPPAPGGRPPVR